MRKLLGRFEEMLAGVLLAAITLLIVVQLVLTQAAPRLWLDLGDVRELAEVRLNGRRLGVVWRPPFRVEITGAVKPVGNLLEVEVVNFWPNRIIGDRRLPPEKRRTRTNIRKLTAKTPLMKSGLLGPVRLMTEKRRPRS